MAEGRRFQSSEVGRKRRPHTHAQSEQSFCSISLPLSPIPATVAIVGSRVSSRLWLLLIGASVWNPRSPSSRPSHDPDHPVCDGNVSSP